MSNPVGFWSYARSDDAHSDGHLSQLRTIVGKAIALQYGGDITIWQDIQAIPPGADWAASIERTISQTVFFIPIVTPRYLKSTHCLQEFQSFRRRMIRLGHDDLIFPILYVGVEQVSADDTAFGNEMEALRRHQWIDFRPLRHADPRSHEVGTWVDGLAENILKVSVPVSKAEQAIEESHRRELMEYAAEEAHQREAAEQAKAAEEARRRKAAQQAAEQAAEEARRRKAEEQAKAEEERRRKAAEQAEAAEEARQREAASKQGDELLLPERESLQAPKASTPLQQAGTAKAHAGSGFTPSAVPRRRTAAVRAALAGAAVVVAGVLATVFLRHEVPRPPVQASASTPASVLASVHSLSASAPIVYPPPTSLPPAASSAIPQQPTPDLVGSVDQILDSSALIVGGRIVNLFGIRGEEGRAARSMQRYLESEGNVVKCFARGEAYLCLANGQDVAEHAVRQGWARVRQGAPPQYAEGEQAARRARIGIWAM
jgi:hypothetical protein